MIMEKRNLLVTGLPGAGKTTLIIRLIERLRVLKTAGFYTEEIRAGGTRRGFRDRGCSRRPQSSRTST